MKRSSSLTFFILALLVTLAFAGGDALLFLRVKSTDESALAKKEQTDFLETRSVRVGMISSALDRNAEFRAKLDSYFVSSDSVVGFLDSLENTAAREGLSVKVSSVAEERPSPDNPLVTAAAFRIALSGSGTWKQTLLFAEDLRALPNKISFTKLDLARSDNGTLDSKGNPVAGSLPTWKSDIEFTVAEDPTIILK